ncbi:mCG1036859, partial [Mus musculus]
LSKATTEEWNHSLLLSPHRPQCKHVLQRISVLLLQSVEKPTGDKFEGRAADLRCLLEVNHISRKSLQRSN